MMNAHIFLKKTYYSKRNIVTDSLETSHTEVGGLRAEQRAELTGNLH